MRKLGKAGAQLVCAVDASYSDWLRICAAGEDAGDQGPAASMEMPA